MNVRIVTDSVSYLPQDVRARYGIEQVSMYVREGESVTPETEIDHDAFFGRLALGKELPTTSQPSPESYAEVFSAAVERGEDVCAVLISAGMSGSVASAEIAARTVRERFRDARISVVDSRSNSMQEGFAVLAAAEAAEAGASLEECEQAARESIRRSRFLFSPESLEYLRRGGRISAAASLLGSVLKIAPVLTAKDGETGVAARVRTHTKALEAIARLMKADVDRCGLKQAVVATIMDAGQGLAFAKRFIEPIVGKAVPVMPIGPVIGLHVGPAVGVAYETVEPLR